MEVPLHLCDTFGQVWKRSACLDGSKRVESRVVRWRVVGGTGRRQVGGGAVDMVEV